ncbi:MAG TPA: permease prefix domain 1-containing protein [Candidatus Limnocylindrales bacterium]
MSRDEYLADLAARLPLPEPQRAEVLEELAAHLGDGVADLVAHGRDPETAEAEVLRRLGSTDELACGLLRARQTRSQLLAAAGAGVVAGLRSGIFGALVGWLFVALASILATVALQYLRPALGLPEWSGWTPGWNSAITGAGLAIGAALGGAAAVRVVAARSWRPASEVRLAVALTGGVVIAYFVLVAAHESLNWASVLAYLSVPVAFVLGARFERLHPPRWRYLLVSLAGVLTAALLFGAVAGLSGSHGVGAYEWTDETHGYAMIAPWWAEPGSPNAAVVGSEEWSSTGFDSVTVDGASAAALARFSDWRLEAWRAEPPQDGWALVPGQTRPLTTSPASVDGATVSGTIAFDSEPGVDWVEVVLTAAGPDGKRYLHWTSGPQQTEFLGSVWSWFAALAD